MTFIFMFLSFLCSRQTRLHRTLDTIIMILVQSSTARGDTTYLLRVLIHVLFIGHDATVYTGCTYKVISHMEPERGFEPGSVGYKATALPFELSSILNFTRNVFSLIQLAFKGQP